MHILSRGAPDGVDLALAHRIVRFLNDTLDIDPDAINALMNLRVPCNEDMAFHPTIQCGTETDDTYYVRIIGLLNGIVGAYKDGEREGWGAIAAVTDDTDGTIEEFIVLKNPMVR